MKKNLALLICLIGFFAAKSQDTIVTTEGDTIKCQITRVSDEFIHFSVFDPQSGILLMRSRLPLSKVQSYKQEERADESVSQENETIPIQSTPTGNYAVDYESISPPSFRLSINTGFTYQFGGYDGFPKTYRDQVQTLWGVGSQLHYFPFESWGVGVKYNYVFTEAEEDFPNTSGGITELRDELIKFNFFAFSILYRNAISDEQALHYSFAGGLLTYRTDLILDGSSIYEQGDTFGAAFGISYDFMLSDNLGVGLGAEMTLASLTEIEVNGSSAAVDFDLSRIDLVVGFRFYK